MNRRAKMAGLEFLLAAHIQQCEAIAIVEPLFQIRDVNGFDPNSS